MPAGVRHITFVYEVCVTLIAFIRDLRQLRDVLARKRRRTRPLNRACRVCYAIYRVAVYVNTCPLVYVALRPFTWRA
jgi:hypothetical protein